MGRGLILPTTFWAWCAGSGDGWHRDRRILSRTLARLSLTCRTTTPSANIRLDTRTVQAAGKKGVPVRQTFTYNGYTKRVRRYVNDFQNAGGKDERKRITALDWMEYASRNPINNPGILENKRGDEVLTQTLALMPIPPQSTNFDTGVNTFPTAFDTVTSKTKAINEFVKPRSLNWDVCILSTMQPMARRWF